MNPRIMERDDVDFLVECRNDIDFWGECVPIGEQISKAEWMKYSDSFEGYLASVQRKSSCALVSSLHG